MYFKRFIIFAMALLLTACAVDLSTQKLNDDPFEEPLGHEGYGQDFSGEHDNDKDPLSTETEQNLNPAERSHLLARYHYLDPNKKVPRKALEETLLFFELHKFNIPNQNYIAVINFAQSSREKRFYIIDMKSGSVQLIHVAHGKGSDKDYDGYAEKFSNKVGTNASSLGFYTTAETYYGEHGLALRLDGRSHSNSNARRRAIVIHGADYVKEADLIQGRSWGCPAVSYELRDKVISSLKGGALINVVK
ncbi:MAG: murein L,D-transpeptidase catalytic domain family protein [Pseudobdellovibrionaceae bacterium]